MMIKKKKEMMMMKIKLKMRLVWRISYYRCLKTSTQLHSLQLNSQKKIHRTRRNHRERQVRRMKSRVREVTWIKYPKRKKKKLLRENSKLKRRNNLKKPLNWLERWCIPKITNPIKNQNLWMIAKTSKGMISMM